MLDAHRDHSQALVWSTSRMVEDQLNDSLDLCRHAVFFCGMTWLERNEHMRHTSIAARTRESRERAVIEVAVRESDEPLVLASVMPGEHSKRKPNCPEHIEDRSQPRRRRQRRPL